jgi:hypothetical protein
MVPGGLLDGREVWNREELKVEGDDVKLECYTGLETNEWKVATMTSRKKEALVPNRGE